MVFTNFFKKISSKIKNLFKLLIKDFKNFESNLEAQLNSINESIHFTDFDKYNKKIKNLRSEKFDDSIDSIFEDENLLNELKSKFKKINELNYVKIEFLNIDPQKPTLLLADDHPGALYQINEDVKTILDKKIDIPSQDLNDDIKKRILNYKLNYLDFNIITFKTEYAPYLIKKICDQVRIDLAVLDIIFGGTVINNDNDILMMDGIDVAENLIKKHDSKILFYSGCTLNSTTSEAQKLNSLINNKNKNNNIYITDKDLDDNIRLSNMLDFFESFYRDTYLKKYAK